MKGVGKLGPQAAQGTGTAFRLPAEDARGWTASEVSGCSWMRLVPQKHSSVACTSMVLRLEKPRTIRCRLDNHSLT